MTTITVVGNLTADPELRSTTNGHDLVSFTVAVQNRKKVGDQWVDDDPSFVRCTAWRQLAENIAASLFKGMQVIVTGEFRQRSWQDKRSGEKRSDWQLDVTAAGPSLAWATASVTRNQRDNNPGNSTRGRGQDQPVQGDPWAAQDQPARQSSQGRQASPWGNDPWSAPQSEQAPF